MTIGLINLAATSGLQRYLEQAQAAQQSALGRLSSGARIRSAADDAAGLAIASRMEVQVRGGQQAMRNANDGISALQTAEGGLAVITENLQRMRELGVQAANDTNARADRAALQAELEQLMAANVQIGLDTEFNGQKLLDGSYANALLQIGAGVGDLLNLGIDTAIARSSSGTALQDVQMYRRVLTGSATAGALDAGDLRINGTAIGSSVAGAAGLGRSASSAWAIANAINAAAIPTIDSVTARTDVNGNSVAVPPAGRTLVDGALTINGVSLGTISATTAGDFANAVKSAIDGSGTGVSATIVVAGNSATINLVSADGGDIAVGGDSSVVTAGTYRGSLTLTSAVGLPTNARILIQGNNPGDAGLTAGSYAADPYGAPVPTMVAVSAGGEPILSLASRDDANEVIRYADAKLDLILDIRAKIGASQSKLSAALGSLANGTENTAAARARIFDADYAAETVALTRAAILEEAGASVLAQGSGLAVTVLDMIESVLR